eukprot:TRINITY_DN4860_c0_g1_i3.p1 TRINITY_DN4860_c0_g1~~TRINITY_DN4860_c0_g1_i3.p1  ORF type:complete len:484 (-),score=92.90 TRINITY_DN4860_c0_g1_i3:100-1551(-)
MELDGGLARSLSASIGFPEDQLKTVLCLLASYPFAFILKSFPNVPAVKHVFGIVLGLFFCTYCLGPYAWIHSFVTSTIVYAFLTLLPLRLSYKVVFIFSMGYMSISHIYRQYNDYMGWTLDYTGPQMLLTLKLSSLGFNYFDGNRTDTEKLNDEMKRRSVKKLPTLLEFYGFVYFFPTFLAGPPMEITDYLNFINMTAFNDKACNGKIPSTVLPSLFTLLKALLCLPMVFLSDFVVPPGFIVSDAFKNLNWSEKMWRIHAHAFPTRFKYYFAWYLSEGSCVASGLGYNGFETVKNGKKEKDEKYVLKWNRLTNVYPYYVEFAQSTRDVATNWNVGVSDWLRNYVYNRVTPPGQKPTFFATLATFSISAFWHGFYPGYYCFFIFVAFLQEIGKDIRRKVRPLVVKSDGTPKQPSKRIYDFLGFVLTEWIFSYLGLSFVLLSFDNTVRNWGAFYFIPNVLLIVVFVIMRFIFPTPPAPKPVAKKE